MSELQTTDLIAKIRALLPFGDDFPATQALRNVLFALGARLTPDERKALGAELPASLDAALNARAGASVAPGDFVASIANLEGVERCRAVEYASGVCRALAETMSFDAIARLRRALPDLAQLFERQPAAPPPSPHPRNPHSLAEGRPGSRHPLASAHRSALRPAIPSDHPAPDGD